MVSKSQFDDPITVDNAGSFTVGGPLGEASGRDVHVSAVIWQGEWDQPSAFATGSGGHAAHSRWTATMHVQHGPFVAGDGNGMAVTVEPTESPVGFETYTWVDQFRIQV
jgi:hypothetical protein